MLALSAVAKLLVNELLVHLASWTLTLTGNHVTVRTIGAIGLVAAAHVEIVLPTDGRMRTMAV